MRGEPVFLGVYAKEGISNNAKRWYAWGLADGKFMLQEMEPNGQNRPKSGFPGKTSAQNVQRLEADEFFAEYRVFSASSPKQQPEFPLVQLDNQAGPDARYEQGGRRGGHDGALSGNAAFRESFSGETVPGAAAGNAPENNPDFVYLWQSDPVNKISTSSRYADPPPLGPVSKTQDQDPDSDISAGELPGYGNPYSSASEAGTGAYYAGIRGQRETGPAYQIDFERNNDRETEPGRAEVAAKVEEQFRTEFSMALIRLKNKRAEALQALDALVKSKGPFNEEHKFMFTDCGLALRKRNLFALAKQFHLKARELSPDDENILFNLARVMYEAGKIDKAREYLCLSMELSPDFEEGKDFLDFIDSAAVSSRIS
jgi:hypothetical protein